MDEKVLNGRLKKAIWLCSLVGIAILISGVMILFMLQNSLGNLVAEQMESKTEEYKRRINHQIERDFYSMDAFASAFSYEEIRNSERFAECLYDTVKGSAFLAMAYFEKSGYGTVAYSEHGIIEDLDYHILDENVCNAIELAFQGEPAVSNIFQSYKAPEKIFVYAVPVYDKDSDLITGVFVAGTTMHTFADVIGYSDKLAGDHAFHLVTSEGKMLLSATVQDLETMPDNIFESDLFTESNKLEIRKATGAGNSAFVDMNYEGQKFHVFLNPVGINDWYIVYSNSHQGVSEIAYRVVRTMAVIFILLIAVITGLLIYICRSMSENNRSLRNLAFKDELTGDDNMLRFYQKMEAARRKNKGFTVVGLNVHQFKFINELFGEQAADRFLRDMARRTRRSLGDDEFFCRDSADRFFMFLWDTDMEIIKNRVDGLMADISSIIISDTADYHILLYSGALICEDVQEQADVSNEMLMTKVCFPMHFSQSIGTNQLHFYTESIHKDEELRHYIEKHMERALKNQEFKMFLQPKVSFKTGEVIGAEALVRWVTRDGRKLYPNMFIPLFESNGFCVRLDMYMAEQACKKVRSWIDQGIEPVSISVNQSKLLFFDVSYIDSMKALMDKYQIPKNLITLEILESLALEHADEINEKLRQLRAMGFRVSMDDFGSGYASFNALGNLEIDELKLDRSFLLEVSEDKSDRFVVIMEYIINMTKRLKIKTVAEGVETKAHEELMAGLGCDYGQGYLYSPPIPEEQFEEKYIKIH